MSIPLRPLTNLLADPGFAPIADSNEPLSSPGTVVEAAGIEPDDDEPNPPEDKGSAS